MMEDHILGNLHNELFSINSEDKYAAFQSMARSLTYSLFIKILLKTAQLSSMHFALTPSHSLYPLFFFHKGKNTLAIFQPSVPHFVYVSAIFFRFHKCFNDFQ